MLYQYEKTTVSLYRAIFNSNFQQNMACYLMPDAELANAEAIAPILHPAFEITAKPGLPTRPADILPNAATGEYDPDTGGTSLFERRGVLKSADGDFLIPDGTDIPPDLKVKQDAYNKRLKATHYTLMPAKPMFKAVLMGQLDNFARNAIRRQVEKSRGF